MCERDYIDVPLTVAKWQAETLAALAQKTAAGSLSDAIRRAVGLCSTYRFFKPWDTDSDVEPPAMDREDKTTISIRLDRDTAYLIALEIENAGWTMTVATIGQIIGLALERLMRISGSPDLDEAYSTRQKAW